MVATVPALGLRIAGLFDRAAREMSEMMYPFTQDFIVVGSAHSQFPAAGGMRPLPVPAALAGRMTPAAAEELAAAGFNGHQ